jgi:radical SAM superfamily enzyme YgiQ (UPF0313 family)
MRIIPYNGEENLEDIESLSVIIKAIPFENSFVPAFFIQSPEEDYRLMKESGCYGLDVGVESFSETVRFELGKKFTDDDMWWCFEMLYKYNIHHTLLMFVGHPFETDSDHQITLDTIRQIAKKGYATKNNNKNKRQKSRKLRRSF